MVDWDRVEELRSKGWDWDRIADDPKVGFHPETSSEHPGRMLRALYHRQRSRQQRQGGPSGPSPKKKGSEPAEKRWTLLRIGYLLVPIVGVWALLAYFVPSPVGVLVPAVPYLLLGLAVVAVILLFALWRTEKDRWTKSFRTTVIIGVVVGLVFSGVVALSGFLVFGCPYLPSASTASTVPGGYGWSQVGAAPWQQGGQPVFYFYGAIWCPYCSASSWAMYKALMSYGTLSGEYTDYSSTATGEPYPATPEMVLGAASLSSSNIAWQVSMYLGGTDGTFPGTSNCYQGGYVSAYGAGSIPFVVINGQYYHAGNTLIDPADLSTWAGGANGGAAEVQSQVQSESGSAWSAIQGQAWFIMAIMAKVNGATASDLGSQPYVSQYHWTSSDKTNVASDLSLL
jgi:uncharacterized membrane protein YuzA (DUF378 family)